MQAVRFLHKAFSQALPTIHRKRLSALLSCVSALLHGHCLTRSALHKVVVQHSPIVQGLETSARDEAASRSRLSRQNARREQEPWLLASNLPQPNWTARKIVGIYRKRMQIEEGFRDVKSLRFGFAFDLHRTRSPRRIEILLLIGTGLLCAVLGWPTGSHDRKVASLSEQQHQA